MSTSTVASTGCLCNTLRQMTRAVTRMYDDALRPVNLRITQFSILTHLEDVGESRVRDLGAALVLEETTLTRGLRLIESSGWVVSRPGDDRRERWVSITPAGRKLIREATPLWAAAQERMKERLSTAAWDGLLRSLPKVAAAASDG